MKSEASKFHNKLIKSFHMKIISGKSSSMSKLGIKKRGLKYI
jgi:hypothetical protein